MNVAFDPWIPVVNTAGRRELASLCEVLTEGSKFADLAVRPHERVALMRLFLCIAHTALDGPKDYPEWCEVPRILPEAARRYLDEWKDSFELFHETKPWLQVAGLNPVRDDDEKSFTPLAKLDFSLASGVNSTLFDHQGASPADRVFDPAQLALGLISIQNFSTCGLLSRPLWNGIATPDSAKDAPCITSSMYHVFLVGKNINDTICINICDFGELSLLMNGTQNADWLGHPVWEQMPMNDADLKSTETFLGRLVPISRAIRLFYSSSRMLYGEALRYSVYPDFPQEFNTSVGLRRSKKKEERYLIGSKVNIRPWRQLDAILQYNLPERTSTRAINLSHLDNAAIDIWVGALVRNPGKQDILDSIESRFHISAQLRSAVGCSVYSAEVQKAYSISRQLDAAVYLYRIEFDSRNETGIGSTAGAHYWTTVENNLTLLLTHIDAINTDAEERTGKKWRSMLFHAVCEAYSLACGRETPRQMRAFAKGWQKLTETRDKSHPDIDSEKEDKG